MTSLVLQGETNECAIACLCMVLGHYKKHTTLTELRRHTLHGRPLSLEELKTLAESQGFNCRALSCDLVHLRKLQLPAILHFDFEHFVVLKKISLIGATILDPVAGERTIDADEMNRRFTGVTLELSPGAGFDVSGSGGGKAQAYSAAAMLRNIPLSQFSGRLGMIFLLCAIVQLFALGAPFFVQLTIDEVLVTGEVSLLISISLAFLSLHLLSFITQWLRGLITLQVSSQLAFSLAAWLFNHLVHLPVTYFQRRNIGDIVSRFNSLQPVQDFITQGVVIMLIDVLMVITTIVALTAYSTVVAATATASIALFVLVQVMMIRTLRRRTQLMITREADTQTHFIETLKGIATLKHFERLSNRQDEWLGRFVKATNAGIGTARTLLAYDLVRYLFVSCSLLLVVYVGAKEALAGAISVGMLYTITAYTNHLTNACQSLTRGWQDYMMLALHVQRMSDIFDNERDSRQQIVTTTTSQDVRLQGVSYHHPGSTSHLLRDLSLQVPAGTSLAITGMSGSGKSTLLGILTGDLQSISGDVYIAGTKTSPQTDHAQCFSRLSQTDALLRGTLAENISLFDPSPDPARLEAAASAACLQIDIANMPLGLATRIGELGSELSAGQLQRLLVARAMYRQAPILVFDEATSHLDEAIEKQVMLNILGTGKTCIFTTHRPSIASLADQHINLDRTPRPLDVAAS